MLKIEYRQIYNDNSSSGIKTTYYVFMSAKTQNQLSLTSATKKESDTSMNRRLSCGLCGYSPAQSVHVSLLISQWFVYSHHFTTCQPRLCLGNPFCQTADQILQSRDRTSTLLRSYFVLCILLLFSPFHIIQKAASR